MSGEPESRPQSGGEAPTARPGEGAATATHGDERSGTGRLMERVVSIPNLQAALKRVEFPLATSTSWASPGCVPDLNSPNRRMRTRTSAGVGGDGGATLRHPYPDSLRL